LDLAVPFLSLIIPAHNEESRLQETLQEIDQFLAKQAYSFEVVVVENGSVDRTLEIARSFEARRPYLKIFHEDQSGKGRAVRRGVLEARGEYRFFCDVDFSMPISEVNRFIPPALKDVDVAIASREAPGAVRYNEPAYRHLAGRVFNTLVRLAALPGLRDTQCGFKCFRAPLAEEIFKRQMMMGWSFDVEVLFIAQRWGYKIVEVPIPWYFKSKSRVRMLNDSWHMALDMMAIRRNARQGRYDRQA
jgi:glycosyltransferase involved in cell wall biosynthesis